MSKKYEKIKFIGEGQFATVYRARDKETNVEVAIKKIKLGSIQEAQDGVNRTALREIKLLQELHHENVIALLDVYGKDSGISLVFEIMETDLEQILHERKIFLSLAHIKSYILMTLKGLEYLHNNWILHRDLKPNNLLLDRNNILKIADFGLARYYGSPSRIYSHQVVTRWYRAPELLYGARMYGPAIDIWAVGCILAELFRREPLFPGDSDLDTLDKIVTVLGAPTERDWHGVTELPDYVRFDGDYEAQPFTERFSALQADAIEILESMLRMCPTARCTCTEALKMPYFKSEPYPTTPEFLPKYKESDDAFSSEAKSDSVNNDLMASDVKVKAEPFSELNDVKPSKSKRLRFE